MSVFIQPTTMVVSVDEAMIPAIIDKPYLADLELVQLRCDEHMVSKREKSGIWTRVAVDSFGRVS